jgi:hypothetical protein
MHFTRSAQWPRLPRVPEYPGGGRLRCHAMRVVAVGIAIALIVYVLSGGRLFFLPLLFIPFGLFGAGHRRRRRW